MPIQISTSGATTGNLTQQEVIYMREATAKRFYDQYASPVEKAFEPKGLTVQRAWLARLQPRPTAAVGSETTDFEPQTVRDYSKTFNKVYLNDGVKAHDLVMLKNSLNIDKELPKLVGDLAIRSIDSLARRAGTEGNLVRYGSSPTVTARNLLIAGTAGHNLNLTAFTAARSILGAWANADNLFVTMTDFQYADLLNTASSVITNKMQYDGGADSALFNYEMGTLAGVRLVVSNAAKRFYAAGNANAVNTTIAASVGSNNSNRAGAATIEVASNASIAVGGWLTIGTVQTSTESDATLITEIVQVSSISGTTITIVGSGSGGTLMYDHAVGDTVKNNDTVHCALFGAPDSLAVAFDGFGRYGKLVPVFEDGKAKQWKNYAFKYYGQYVIFDQSKMYRVETSASGQ